MDSIRIERLRCLSDTNYVQIKPITILLGQNSSGKSTFLRFFPLLKQSIASRTTGPILWFGRLVDFGNFDNAHQIGSENTIAFSFKFQLKENNPITSNDLKKISLFSFLSEELIILNSFDIYLTLQLSEDKEKQTTWINRLILQFEDSKIQLDFSENEHVSGFTVNSLNILDYGIKYTFSKFNNSHILPFIKEIRQKHDSDLDLSRNNSKSVKSVIQMLTLHTRPLTKLFQVLTEKIKLNLHHSIIPEEIYKLSLCFGLGNSETMLNNIKRLNSWKIWQKKTKVWTVETKEFKEIRDLIIANSVPTLIEKCDNILANFSKRISYMGPLRATAERYYRNQNLAVDEVDYQGSNLAMFLSNLTSEERQDFSSWTLLHFGFELLLESSTGHISLKICTKDSEKNLNIADTGFGFSQILPIITQLWFLSSSKKSHRRNNEAIYSFVYAIEQPELHLHPRLQGNLTDALVASIKVAKENNINLRLVIETHSEVLVNRIGYLVAEGKISSDEISIVLFETSSNSGEITIKNSHFDTDGYLVDWPLGFLDMDTV